MTDKLITYEKTIIGVIGVHLHNNPNSDRHKIEFTTKELNCITEHMKNYIDFQKEHEALKKDVAIFKDTLNSIKAICNEPSPSWILSLAEISKRYIEIDNLINTYDEKLSKIEEEK